MTDINEIIGRAAIAGNIYYTEAEIGAAVLKALGDAGYEIVHRGVGELRKGPHYRLVDNGDGKTVTLRTTRPFGLTE